MLPIRSLIIQSTGTFRDALKVTSRGLDIGFIVDDNMHLRGVISDGDIRRALLTGKNLDDPIDHHYNHTPVLCDSDGNISGEITEKIKIVPILDHNNILIQVKPASELKKVALITGVTGQDGAYLAHFLLGKGYTVIGAYRRSSTDPFERLKRLGIENKVELVTFDLADAGSCIRILSKYNPQEVYNLAAQSFVYSSFGEPHATLSYTGGGALNLLEAIRHVDSTIRFYQASSSEMYGKVREVPQTEETPFYPRSPYAAAKAYAHWITINYRESYDLFACSGILFNHESPLRGLEFVTRKITHTAAQIKLGLASELMLGNLDATRDWGYAYDYIKCMWLMLQQDTPDDYVIATGQNHSVRYFLETTFKALDIPIAGHIKTDPRFMRPAEVQDLQGSPQKACEKLDWNPLNTPLDHLIKIMVEADLALLQDQSHIHPESDLICSAAT